MGLPLGTCLVLSLALATVADEDVHLHVQSYNSSVVQLSCTNKGVERESFPVFKDGRKCIDYDSDCSYYNQDYCKFSCKESDDPNVVLFQVKLNGSCQEQMTIRCGTVKHGIHLVLAAQSDSPVILINDGKPVQSGTSPVPIVCSITNKCSNVTLEISGPSGVRLSPVVSNHMKHGDRFTTTAETEGKFYEAGSYTITCKEKGKEGQFANNLTIEVHEPNSGLMKEEQLQKGKGLSDGTLAAVILVLVALLFIAIFLGLYCRRRRQRSPNRPIASQNSQESQQHNDMEEGRSPRKLPGKKIPEIFKQNDSICGIWVDKDDEEGAKIFDYITSRSDKEIHRAELCGEGMSSLLESRSYKGYFALISSHSLENKVFMAHLTSVIVLSVKHESTLVLVLLENDVLSNNRFGNSLITDLKALDDRFHVDASDGLDEDRLKSIDTKLKGHHFEAEDLANLDRPIGDIGVGLAWIYFLGYLKYILPRIKERIKEYESQKRHKGKMYPHFIIVIPESGSIPTGLNRIDQRFSTYGPLDDGIERPTSGHPERHFKNFVHKIKKKEGDSCYFCGEWSSSVLTLYKLRDDELLRSSEMSKQLKLFTETLQSILQGDPSCRGNFVIFTFKDDSTSVDRLYDMIENPNEGQTLCKPADSVIQVTRLAKGLAKAYHNQLIIFGPKLAESIRSTDYYSEGTMPLKLFILLPHSCKCFDTVANAENVTYIEKLHLLQKDIGGNKRSYDAAIYEIQENYYACVEYCTTLKTMYEMAEKEHLSGLSAVQMAAELRVYYEILYDLLSASPEFGHSIELVYYDDTQNRKLSDILVKKIQESLVEEASEKLGHQSPAKDSQPLLERNELT